MPRAVSLRSCQCHGGCGGITYSVTQVVMVSQGRGDITCGVTQVVTVPQELWWCHAWCRVGCDGVTWVMTVSQAVPHSVPQPGHCCLDVSQLMVLSHTVSQGSCQCHTASIPCCHTALLLSLGCGAVAQAACAWDSAGVEVLGCRGVGVCLVSGCGVQVLGCQGVSAGVSGCGCWVSGCGVRVFVGWQGVGCRGVGISWVSECLLGVRVLGCQGVGCRCLLGCQGVGAGVSGCGCLLGVRVSGAGVCWMSGCWVLGCGYFLGVRVLGC